MIAQKARQIISLMPFKKEMKENMKGRGRKEKGRGKLCSRKISCKFEKMQLAKACYSWRIPASQGFVEPIKTVSYYFGYLDWKSS